MRWIVTGNKLALGQSEIKLTPAEAKVTGLLAARNGSMVPTDALIARMYEDDADGGVLDADAVLKQHVFRIRRKLDGIDLDGKATLRNEPAWGYALVVPE